MARRVRFTEEEACAAVAASLSYSEALRRLGLRAAGGNHATLKKYVAQWQISTDHFDPYATQRVRLAESTRRQPIEQILVQHSTYSRGHLKERLYREGLKTRVCELCGQDEEWRGGHMSLILDHINGIGDDNRLENLRIVCPNCAATFDTHCGRQNQWERACVRCGEAYRPRSTAQRHCSKECGLRASSGHGPRPSIRKVARPPHARLVREVHAMGWSAVGRRYGVSDNAVRKWVAQYEREAETEGDAAA
ncbi:MAG TPA: HNH endonuclease [Baekduia sp.]|uniref:HNH endonuclease n=1 Tax=Baekduia sp. TaxID=2600305 RepID=UPI002BC98C00|nr:HNH endonuclease [Baekduia sp.]HMJ33305.1 HNH endonuclease [Baekduia sp.]